MKWVLRCFCAVVILGLAGLWLWLVKLERSYRDEPYSLIEDGLYVGRAVAEAPPGTRAVVNVCDLKDRYEVDHLFWEPIVDGWPPPSINWLRRVVEFIDTQRRAGYTTYIHCAAGGREIRR
jgi:hypothetical protein